VQGPQEFRDPSGLVKLTVLRVCATGYGHGVGFFGSVHQIGVSALLAVCFDHPHQVINPRMVTWPVSVAYSNFFLITASLPPG
jgi:hypothetical protein